MSDAQRLVPGAPPQIAVSKSQQKRKKKAAGGGAAAGKPAGSSDAGSVAPSAIPDAAAAALVDKAPEPAEIKDGAVAPELVAPEAANGGALTPAPNEKRSPVYDLVHKRQKAMGKKLVSACDVRMCGAGLSVAVFFFWRRRACKGMRRAIMRRSMKIRRRRWARCRGSRPCTRSWRMLKLPSRFVLYAFTPRMRADGMNRNTMQSRHPRLLHNVLKMRRANNKTSLKLSQMLRYDMKAVLRDDY